MTIVFSSVSLPPRRRTKPEETDAPGKTTEAKRKKMRKRAVGCGALSISLRAANRTPDFFGCGRHVDMGDADWSERVDDSVHDGGECPDITGFAGTLDAQRVGFGGPETGVYEVASFSPEIPNFPNGCHVCEVEIDPETGTTRVLRYVVVDDVGTVINQLTLEGQIHGGVVQGIGQAFTEQLVCDSRSGQFLSGSLMDYGLPRADKVCAFEMEENPVPTPAGATAHRRPDADSGDVAWSFRDHVAGCSNMMSPPKRRSAGGLILAVSGVGSILLRLIAVGFAAGCRRRDQRDERCGRGGRGWRRHKSDRR